jgi:dTDP-4-dehydrorhamnose reductase
MYGWSSRYTESMAEWILRELVGGLSRDRLNMYHHQYRQFILINDLVATIFELTEYSGLGELNGHQMKETIHVVGPELLSRYEFAKRLAQTFGLPEVGIRSIVGGVSRRRAQAASTPPRD